MSVSISCPAVDHGAISLSAFSYSVLIISWQANLEVDYFHQVVWSLHLIMFHLVVKFNLTANKFEPFLHRPNPMLAKIMVKYDHKCGQ